ncbi:MAG: glutamine synthetase type III, partial [Clostridia bacterium]|nr:glutamine synthetase type III [Clostridia bacterium]
RFADELEGHTDDLESAMHELIKRTFREHKRVIFNGNGYDAAWKEEAARRGLMNLPSTPDALPELLREKNIALFETHRVFSEDELRARFEIREENYGKIINIEALTLLDMMRKDVLPALSRFSARLAENAKRKLDVDAESDVRYEKETAKKISGGIGEIYDLCASLDEALIKAREIEEPAVAGFYYREHVRDTMEKIRAVSDAMEMITDASFWPYPSIGQLLFSVQ